MRVSFAALLVGIWLVSPAFALTVNISNAMRACTVDDDCVRLNKDCDDSCNFDVLAKDQQPIFETQKKTLCREHLGIRDCPADQFTNPTCVNKRCVLEAEKFPVPEALRKCKKDADCGIVAISCAGCCQYDAAPKAQQADYYSGRESVCDGADRVYGRAPQKDRCKRCSNPNTLYRSHCVDGSCALVATQKKKKS